MLVLVLVLVVVLTVCINHVFVDIIKRVHPIMGAVSLWTRPPALYLCTGPKKIPTSAQHRDDELPRPQVHPESCTVWTIGTSPLHTNRHRKPNLVDELHL